MFGTGTVTPEYKTHFKLLYISTIMKIMIFAGLPLQAQCALGVPGCHDNSWYPHGDWSCFRLRLFILKPFQVVFTTIILVTQHLWPRAEIGFYRL